MMVTPSDIYCQVASKPILKIATVLNQGDTSQCHIKLQWEQEDPVRRDSVEFQQTAVLSINAELRDLCLTSLTEATFTSLTRGFPFPKEGNARVLWDLHDDVGGTRAICLEYNPPTISKSAPSSTRASCSVAGTFVQIWSANRLRKTITLPTKGSDAKHGRVYSDGPAVFSGANLSHNGTNIVYTAEEYRPDDPEVGTGQPSLDKSPFAYRENWGEGVADVYQPVLCLLDIESESVTCIVDCQTTCSGVAPTRPVWTRNDEAVVCLGYALDAYPLGVTYCTQRPCRVFAIWPASGQVTALSSADCAASCPRFSPDGRHLIWLQEPVGGPHRHCRALVALAWSPTADTVGRPETIVGCVNQPGEDGFPGLYDDLPLRCWTADSASIITSSVWGFKTAALLISVVKPTGEYARDEVQLIPSPLSADNNDDLGRVAGQRRLDSVSILDVHKNLVVASVSSLDRAPFLSVLYLEKTLACTGLRAFSSDMWICVPASMSDELAEDKSSGGGISSPVDVRCSYYLVRSGNLKDRNLSESLLVIPTPENDSAAPQTAAEGGLAATTRLTGLVVWPHGGPHSSFTAGWSPLLAAFLGCGFACLLVNYRGSLGYGEDQILGLIEAGIGEGDVTDCAEATRMATAQLVSLLGQQPSIFLFGGSHGGFLCLWLAAGHALPFYRASVVRNPVSHLVSMVDTSDIPDWCYSESGILPVVPGGTDSYQLGHTPDNRQLVRLSRVSPLPRITSDWSTPLLLCLGGKDCRVPMSQGLSVLRKIRSVAKDVPCQALVFPHDAHPLASPAASREVFLATFDWFTQHA